MGADTGCGCDDSRNVNIIVNVGNIQISAVWQQQNIYADGSIMDQISVNDLVKHRSVCVIHKQPYICPDYPQAAVWLLTARCHQISHARPSNNLAFLWELSCFSQQIFTSFQVFFFLVKRLKEGESQIDPARFPTQPGSITSGRLPVKSPRGGVQQRPQHLCCGFPSSLLPSDGSARLRPGPSAPCAVLAV